MARNIAAGNWKMNLNLVEARQLINALLQGTRASTDREIILSTPYVYLAEACELVKHRADIKIAAQNVSHMDKGAYTGEISGTMLDSIGVEYVLVGHSERRTLYNESDEILARKLKASFLAGLKPIFCCGEPLEIRKSETHEAYVVGQLKAGLSDLDASQLENLIIAYEPIWAIGTGETASPEQAQSMHATIRQFLANSFGKTVSENTPILYGGSVKPNNAQELFACADINGGLVGGASLKADDFKEIIEAF